MWVPSVLCLRVGCEPFPSQRGLQWRQLGECLYQRFLHLQPLFFVPPMCSGRFAFLSLCTPLPSLFKARAREVHCGGSQMGEGERTSLAMFT